MKDCAFIRLLQDPPLDGASNMARDEALLARVGPGESPPTLRLYAWNRPTISLGYFQRFADFESLPSPAGDLPVVRRLTGGGAILHDQELTYSLALPQGHRLLSEGPNRLYELLHDVVIACADALGVTATRDGETDQSGPRRGPFLCFERRHRFDVLVGADKLAGSAQRRTRDGVLQHGSIILANRYAQQPTAQVPMPYESATEYVRHAFENHLARVTQKQLKPDDWCQEELAAAAALLPKYAGEEWTKRI